MSHFSLLKVKIKNPNIQLLKKAVEQVAKELNATIVNQITDYYGRVRNDIIIGIKNDVFHRGIGIIVENNEVKLIGDFWGVGKAKVEEIEQLLTQSYTALAVQSSLQALGYQVTTQKIQDKIIIKGVTI